MKRLQFRVRPAEELSDIDIELIEQRLGRIAGVVSFKIYDDRISDATFVSVFVMVAELSRPVLEELARVFLGLPKMLPFLVNQEGEQYELDEVKLEDFERFSQGI
jgi:hypothetical protein